MLQARILRGAGMLILGAALSGCSGGSVSYGRPQQFGYDLTPTRQAGGEAMAIDPGDVEGSIRRIREAGISVTTPISLAVSEGQSASPRQSLMAALNSERPCFSRVQPLPAVGDADTSDQNAEVSRVDRARALAASIGATHLLLVEGQFEQGEASTPLALFDITILGGFLIPSRVVGAKARLGGALIDVASGRFLAYVTAEEDRRTLVPSALAGGGCMGWGHSDYPAEFREETVDLAMGKLAKALAERVGELGKGR